MPISVEKFAIMQPNYVQCLGNPFRDDYLSSNNDLRQFYKEKFGFFQHSILMQLSVKRCDIFDLGIFVDGCNVGCLKILKKEERLVLNNMAVTQIIVKEENCVKYESSADMLQSDAVDHINFVEIKQEQEQEDHGGFQSCKLQIKSEAYDQKVNSKCEADNDIHINQESSANEELNIKIDIEDDQVDQTVKKPIGKKTFQCNVCFCKCLWKSSLQQHMTIHTGEKPFQCDLCNYKCSRKSNLQKHIKVHTGEKPFQCNICDNKFSQKSSLQMHIKIHTGEKQFQCNKCDYKCFRNSALQMHMKIHTGAKPFHCDICDYKCSWKRSLQMHMKVHTGEKSFQCDICNYNCLQKSDLQKHMKIHSGEKPFQCNICDYKFSRKSNLKVHMKIHTREKAFQCDICHYKFSRKSSLQMHMKIHAGEKPFQCSMLLKKFFT